ncbi:lipase [Pseudoalteromonas porphyrae]|uniref:Lipase n=1 Tax=Pseudoalteromonas porphyrae TaxID=187330 RepID=A0A0N1EDM3_9GAMM|nr:MULTISPECIES: triacylglycerol lipase [Pseudoalteromonas]KPH57715.1 lipase [Pseudoalteromonas porphyrae]KPH94860.1 lipase [Pseudoalteromonas porphyrae]NMR24969.1 triacylglycerol lipase [Pseudoalteromonas sp. NEC-BIFX-2020_015]NNG43620.1 triacylglycerol lipase [Pseudoalteromonas sp. NEC-BIFX-2020_002]
MKKIIVLSICSLLFIFSSAASAGYTQTKYPLVLAHGIMGFDDVLGIDYFYRLPTNLSKDGARVYVTSVSSVNSSEQRGEQLLLQVEQIMALTGASKVNLIGHSQGAQSIRYVASIRPDIVASATSVGGVNFGSPVADVVRQGLTPGSKLEGVAKTAFNAFGGLIALLSGNSGLPQNAVGALESLTTEGALAFNLKYPEGLPASQCEQGPMQASNGVYYFSWSGTRTLTNIFDPSDAALAITSLLIPGDDDGLVSRCSSHLGYVLKDNYKMNHLDEVNQMIGFHHIFETDPLTVYRQHANRLKRMGL